MQSEIKAPSITDEVLVQVRVPVQLADRIKDRAHQTGMATSHWVRDAIVRLLDAPELRAWSIEASEVGKDTPALRNLEFGRKNPHYFLVVRDFAGDGLCVEVRGGPAQGRPATEPLSHDVFRAVYGRSLRGQHLFIRGAGFWVVEHVFDVTDRPLVAFLRFEQDPPFDREVNPTRSVRSRHPRRQ